MASIDFIDDVPQNTSSGSEMKRFCGALGDCICCRGSSGVLCADKILRSTGYLIILIIMSVLILAMFIWGLVDVKAMNSAGYITMDAIVMVELLIEILIKLIANRPKAYIRNPWNIFDLIVFVLCLVGFIVNIVIEDDNSDDANAGDVGEYVATGLLVLREIIVVIRIIRIIREGAARIKKKHMINKVDLGIENQMISFTSSDIELDP